MPPPFSQIPITTQEDYSKSSKGSTGTVETELKTKELIPAEHFPRDDQALHQEENMRFACFCQSFHQNDICAYSLRNEKPLRVNGQHQTFL
jgi:hypothetical protein